jgi:hypothetical protein
MKHVRAATVFGIALIVVGVGSFALTLVVDAAAKAEVIAGNFPVNEGAMDPGDITAHNSPTVARNPARPENLVVVNRIDRPDFSCSLHTSFDGGATFEEGQIPLPDEKMKCFAPDATFDAAGTLYVSFVTLEGLANVPAAGWITRSDDGGVTFSDPVRVLDELSFQVRLIADPEVPQRLYLTWLQAEDVAILAFPGTSYPILSARSDDGGATWSEPVPVTDDSRARVVAPSPAVGGAGEIYVAYLDLGEDKLDYNGGHQGMGGPAYPGTWQLVLARSDDRGDSWSETVVADAVTPTERFIVFLPAFPSVAVEPEGGRVHVAFHDGSLGDSDVYVWTSEDRGRTFGDAVRVNDTREGDGSTQRLPKIAVAEDGRVDIIYFDRRADSDDVLTDVSFQYSYDGGLSFRPRIRLNDEAFSSLVGVGSEVGLPDQGSRLGLISTGNRALGVWTDTRAGTEASSKQDVVRAVVEFSDEAALPDPVVLGFRYGGVALAVVGLIVLASSPRPGSVTEPGEAA